MRSLLALILSSFLQAQTTQPPLTIGDVVARAGANYPSVRVSQEQLAAAAAGIQLARTTYLPRIDALAQVNRATRNNIFGLTFPQSVLPSLSGPVLGTNNLTNVWGSAIGVTVAWEPFDFGLRDASVAVSEAAKKRAEAAVRRTQFEVKTLAADAYLTLLAAEETVKAAQASLDRASAIEKSVDAVVRAELRPGADLSRAVAERALAETQLIQARQSVDVARAALSQLTGLPAEQLRISGLPGSSTAAGDAAASGSHPLALEQAAAIDEVKSREKVLDRAYFPKFNLQGTTYARGSGANVDGTTGGAFSGFGPNIQNWAVGFTVTFPIFDFASLRAKKQVESHNERVEAAKYDQILTELNGQVARAKAVLNGARQVARNTPVQRKAARDGEQQATARYKAGLTGIVEVAEAERLLTQTEIDDALAQLAIRRAELAVAVAAGDLDSFLASVKQ